MAVIQPGTDDSKPYIEELGDNRGVKITITGSTFSHSRFCKGMLVYKKRPFIESTFDHLVYSLSSSNSIVEETSDNSMIKITTSTFENLNFGRVLSTISLLDKKTLPIATLTDVEYPTFDNHGAVLNLQGFPGWIKVYTSTFSNNMVYVPEIYPSRRSASDETELFSNFKNSLTGQIKTSRCDKSL